MQAYDIYLKHDGKDVIVPITFLASDEHDALQKAINELEEIKRAVWYE